MSDVFVSYSSEDRDRVEPLVRVLEAAGLSVWWDTRIDVGSSFDREIEHQLDDAACVVVVWSNASVESEWVREEAQDGFDRKVLIPVQIDKCRLPIGFRRIQTAQLIGWPEQREAMPDVIARVHNVIGPRERPAEQKETPEAPAKAKPVEGSRLAGGRKWLPVASVAALVLVGVVLIMLPGRDEAPFPETPAQIDEANRALVHGRALAVEGRYLEAYAKAMQARQGGADESELLSLFLDVTLNGTLTSQPSGADVYLRPYGRSDTDWIHIGQTPIINSPLPRGVGEWKLEHLSGVSTQFAVRNPSVLFGNSANRSESRSIEMPESVPPDQVYVQRVEAWLTLLTFAGNFETGPFLIDRYEITNAQYKEFIDAGGYDDPRYWADFEFQDLKGEKISWEAAKRMFIDSTDRPGPSTWELSSYPPEAADLPVGGVSWYEAMAYARFRNRDLPTRYHWARAALDIGLAEEIVGASNFRGDGPQSVRRAAGIGPFGTYDMAGNVREWTYNRQVPGRIVKGGAWSDPEYQTILDYSLPEMDRSAINGFRTVEYLDDGPTELQLADVKANVFNPDAVSPYSDEAYNVLIDQYDYQQGPVSGQVIATEESPRGWRRQMVLIDSRYVDEGFRLYLYLPLDRDPPYQPVIFFPGLYAFQTEEHSETNVLLDGSLTRDLDFILRSGRALLWPVYHGSYERYDDYLNLSPAELTDSRRRRTIRWRSDVGEVLDYLESRPDIAVDQTAYLGISYGALAGPALLADEPRIKTAILMLGIMNTVATEPAIYRQENHLPRVTQPVFLMSGEFDYLMPLESQKFGFSLLGTPPEHKKQMIFPIDHSVPPRSALVTHGVDWLDTYIGPVD